MTPGRRRFAILLLAVLLVIHLCAFGLYWARDRQSRLLGLYLDARDQWREGHLDTAAAEYTAFLAERPSAAWPVVLFRNFPSAASGWFVLGRVEAERGRVDAALTAFSRAMQLEPGRGRREYRDLLLLSGRPAALAAFARLELARDPSSVPAARDLGAALLALGQPAEAAQAYEQALAGLPALLARIDPASPGGLSSEEADLRSLLSVAARRAGDRARADVQCAEIGRRQATAARLDRLCLAFARADAGDAAGSRAALAGYLPPAPEHEALVRELLERLGG